jgi:hypothetical protein
MSDANQLSQVEQIFLNLEKKLGDTTWIEAQEPEFIKDLTALKAIVLNLATDLNTFLSIYWEYNRLVQENIAFLPGSAENPENGKGMPTQTPAEPAPANRAERRARKTPLEVVQDKK